LAGSDGAFDITVGPLMELWDSEQQFRRPTDAQVREVMAAVGTNKIIFHASGDIVNSASGMKVDCGAIAKGYAVDCACQHCARPRIQLFDHAGGDIYCLGKTFRETMDVAIQDPRGPGMVRTNLL
jgi:thiamine biosynthesis lipoprotein